MCKETNVVQESAAHYQKFVIFNKEVNLAQESRATDQEM